MFLKIKKPKLHARCGFGFFVRYIGSDYPASGDTAADTLQTSADSMMHSLI